MKVAIVLFVCCLIVINSQVHNVVYDMRQLSTQDLDNSTIQWNFAQSGSVELISSSCLNTSFLPQKKDFSQIRLLFPTSVYKQPYFEYITRVQVGFEINCSNDFSNINWFQLHNKENLNESIPYTRVTINVGKCDETSDNISKGITDISVLFRLKRKVLSTDIIGGNIGRKHISPLPNTECDVIDNFKTIFIPSMPSEFAY